MNNLIITVNLPGRILGPVKEQSHTQSVKDIVTNKFVKIVHTDRDYAKCYSKINIPSEIVKLWTEDVSPGNISPKNWNKLTKNQKIEMHVMSFDEGFGVSYSFV